MNLNDDVVYRWQRLGPLHQLHPGRSRSLVRHDDRLHDKSFPRSSVSLLDMFQREPALLRGSAGVGRHVQIALVVDDGRCRLAVLCARIYLPVSGDGADHNNPDGAMPKTRTILMTLFHVLVNR